MVHSLTLAMYLAACTGKSDDTGGTGGDTGSGTDTDTTDSGATDTDDTDGTVDTSPATCLPDGAVDVLQRHLEHVDSAVGLLVGHPSSVEAIAFLDAPGFEGPLNYFSLFQPCAEPTLYDEYCDPETGLCSQIECTGDGAGWVVHLRNGRALDAGAFHFEAITGTVAWADGSEGFDWTVASTGTDDGGIDWSTTGAGSVTPSGSSWSWTLAEALPAMSPAGPADLTVEHGPSGGSGSVVIGAVTVATIGDELAITATGDCP